MIHELGQKEIQQFIVDNEDADPFDLSLKHKTIHGISIKEIANQIQARKKAKAKLPKWYKTEGIIYPPLLSMEQCSSEITAKYKSSIIQGNSLIDLTGGTGVDTFYLSKAFDNVTYIERNSVLCELAKHNFHQLQRDKILVINAEAKSFINAYDKKVTAIFIDPARRDQEKNKVFLWKDCEPDITALQDTLLEKANDVLIKASPMLDITASMNELNHITEVHIVAVKNECKEVLYKLSKISEHTLVKIKTVNFDKPDHSQTFEVTYNEESNASAKFSEPQKYLYEPNAAIMKAGAFKTIGQRFALAKLHPHTHLYTSKDHVKNFPGRSFKISVVVPYNKKAVLKHVPNKKANIAVRNFPEDVLAIRKKTGIKPGGDVYIFGATISNNQKAIIICKKLDR